MKYVQLTLAVLCLALYGCGTKGNQKNEIDTDFELTLPYTVSIDITKAVPMDDALSHHKYVNFTEDVENIMAIPQNVVVKGDTIYAIDAYKSPGIYAYLTNGEQLFAYCSVGNGGRYHLSIVSVSD